MVKKITDNIVTMQENSNDEKKWCVYIHKNKITNKAYIGITSLSPQKRWGPNGNGYNTQISFYGAIQKYGWDNFEHIIWAEGLTEKEAEKLEVILIALFKTNCCKYKNPTYGYNMTDGGEGGNGCVRSDEVRNKISIAQKGRLVSDEIRNKLSDIMKEKFKDPENNPMYGKHHSDETKEKISQNLIGKMSGDKNPMYQHSYAEETIEKMREAKRKMFKAVFCVELNEIFESTRAAERKYNIDCSQIIKCCKDTAKSAGKHPITGEPLHWKYADLN